MGRSGDGRRNILWGWRRILVSSKMAGYWRIKISALVHATLISGFQAFLEVKMLGKVLISGPHVGVAAPYMGSVNQNILTNI